LRQAELFKQDGLGGGDLGGSGAAVKVAEQHQQPAHERRVGITAEVAPAVAYFPNDPRQGDAAAHALGIGALTFGQRRAGAGAVHDGGEPLLRILDQGEVVDHLLLFLREGHRIDGAGLRPACKRRAGTLNRRMVNPFAISWLWRGFKGNSVTFALLFASFLIGWSLSHYVNVLLTRLGVHWLYAMMLPAFFFMWLAKREDRIIPDESKRKLWARGLIAGSILLVLLIAWVKSRP